MPTAADGPVDLEAAGGWGEEFQNLANQHRHVPVLRLDVVPRRTDPVRILKAHVVALLDPEPGQVLGERVGRLHLAAVLVPPCGRPDLCVIAGPHDDGLVLQSRPLPERGGDDHPALPVEIGLEGAGEQEAREVPCAGSEMGRPAVFDARVSHSVRGKIARHESIQRDTIAPPSSCGRNFDGTAIRPFSSTECRYSPVNTTWALPRVAGWDRATGEPVPAGPAGADRRRRCCSLRGGRGAVRAGPGSGAVRGDGAAPLNTGPFPTRHHFVPLDGHLTHRRARVNPEIAAVQGLGVRTRAGRRARSWSPAGPRRARRGTPARPAGSCLAISAWAWGSRCAGRSAATRLQARRSSRRSVARGTPKNVGDADQGVTGANRVDPAVGTVRAGPQQTQAALGRRAGVDRGLGPRCRAGGRHGRWDAVSGRASRSRSARARGRARGGTVTVGSRRSRPVSPPPVAAGMTAARGAPGPGRGRRASCTGARVGTGTASSGSAMLPRCTTNANETSEQTTRMIVPARVARGRRRGGSMSSTGSCTRSSVALTPFGRPSLVPSCLAGPGSRCLRRRNVRSACPAPIRSRTE